MITTLQPTEAAIELVTARLASHYHIAPIRIDADGALVIATEDPEALDILGELRLALNCAVRAEKAPRHLIEDTIREYYGVGADTLEQLVGDKDLEILSDGPDHAIDDAAADASIIKFVNELIVDAYASRATDIHIEPFEHKIRVRYRIDGILFDANIPQSIHHFRDAIVSRIKIMANLDIAERRLPQDGRIRIRIHKKDFDLRVSVIPIAHGESVNIRILQRSNVLLGLQAVGFSDEHLKRFTPMLSKPHGILLLTGPTGSGKTTTLYACLSRINETERKILTIEDPVEYQIEGICQMQARPTIGLSFANGLRSMLRHDPDVILIGEIRDYETAELAIRCALTGHLVFSTLHTNDAPGAMPRLIDIGVEPYLLASSVQAVVAQRLVRTICADCKTAYVPDPSAMTQIGESGKASDATYFHGVGCDECRQSGYHGRSAIHEMFVMDDAVRQLVMQRAPGSTIQQQTLRSGMTTLRKDGHAKTLQGITTIDEVLRVTQEDQR